MKNLVIATSCLFLSLACQSTGGAPIKSTEQLAEWMTGSFSSAAQAAEQPDDFYDIRLFMVPIWTGRDDGPWLYIEQSAASALDKPYRQRVYRLVDIPRGVRSDVFELPGDPLEFAGAWRTPEQLDSIDPSSLAGRTGCSIFLDNRGVAYLGSTEGEGCSSTLDGASHATSEVSIERDLLTSWDRGWDTAGNQVWGAEYGPYFFARVETAKK